MARWKSLLAGMVVISGTVLAVLWQSPALKPAPGHRPLHIGCPPGSHGKPRYSGAGEALQRARSGEAEPASDNLSSRSLTAGHPASGTGQSPPR